MTAMAFKKAAALLSVLAAILFIARIAASRPPQAPSAALPAVAYLIRLGTDGVDGADWSGAVQPPPSRIRGWQFQDGDSSDGARWTAVTPKENYWDTPYERAMRGTSHRDKVTTKGVLIEYDRPPSAPFA